MTAESNVLPTVKHVKETKKGSTINAKAIVAIVIPTFNESENISVVVSHILALNIPNTIIIIVDDSSPDGTSDVVKKLAAQPNVQIELLQRSRKMGLGTAYVAGFEKALGKNASYILQMDADLSHSPKYIPVMLEKLSRTDIVIGSRYISGGKVDQSWGIARKFLSTVGNTSIRVIGRLNVKDTTSGFKAFRSEVLNSLDLTDFRCKGFGFQVEMAHACQQLGYRVAEHPISFMNRGKGQSKMSFSIVFEAIWHLVALRWRRWP